MSSELFVQTIKGPTSGANANKIIIPSGQTLDASAGGFTTPAGHVIQVVSTTKTDTYSESISARGLGAADVTGLTATITPISASSRLIVYIVVNTSNGDTATAGFRLHRDGSAILVGDTRGSRNADTVGRNFGGNVADQFNTFSFGEVPANAATSTTFSIRLRNNAGSTQTLHVNRSGTDSDDNARSTPISSIMIMEIAG
jgi:hypothetical protein